MLKEIEERFSCKSYKGDKIPAISIIEILKAGNLAPSPFNAQPWEFILVDDHGKIGEMKRLMEDFLRKTKGFPGRWIQKKLMGLCESHGLEEFDLSPEIFDCPSLIVMIETKKRSGKEIPFPLSTNRILRSGYTLGLGAAMENICLQAKKEGLDSCMVQVLPAVYQKELKRIFAIPPRGGKILVLITLGYRKEEPKQPKKLGISEVTYHNSYGLPFSLSS